MNDRSIIPSMDKQRFDPTESCQVSINQMIEQEDDFSDVDIGNRPETNERWHAIAKHALARYYNRQPSVSELNGYIDRLTTFMADQIEDAPEEFVDDILNTREHGNETFFMDMANVLLGPRD